MTELVDRSIAALRSNHDQLEKVVAGLTSDQLTGPSGASEWSLAQVLSHLGSGAELTFVTIATAVAGSPVGAQDNQSVWDRWNAASPQEQAAWFVEHDERLVALLEGLTPEQRETLTVELAFLPEPASLSLALGMRLNETAAHAWDVRVGLDENAQLDQESAALVAEHLTGDLAFLLGFAAKPGALAEPAIVELDGYALAIDEQVRVVSGVPEGVTASFSGPLESAVRMLSGRLKPEYTPAGVAVTGNVSLDDLRLVFPGY
ncbi:MAG: hypothetical protein JWR85_2947 [Marmoricola sp.]|nr:hypothetical protein [Marmoricola sp.]